MDASGSDDIRALEREIAALRERARVLHPGGQERWNTEADLAELLFVHALEVASAGAVTAAGAPLLPDGLAEARALLDRLLSQHRPGSASYHWACLLAARAARVEAELTGDPDARDAAIEQFETAIAPLPPHGPDAFPPLPGEPEWWTPALAVDARCELGLALYNRSRELTGGGRSRDLDRIVALLTPVVDGPDAGLAQDLQVALACLGLALADRSRAPDHRAPDRLADRTEAIGRLRAARETPSEDEVPGAVPFQLALLLFCEHDDGCGGSEGADGHGPYARPTGELDEALALLWPLTRDPSADGGEATELATMTARHLYEHDGGPAAETALIEWHRRAIDHPGTQRRQVRANRTDLALLLIDRAERGAPASAPGAPGRSDDLGEAARHLELALDDLALKERAPTVRLRAADEPPETDADRAEERLNILLGLVTLLSMLLPESSDDARLDRLIRRGQELIDVIPDADTERGGACLRLALALFERTSRRTLPQLPALLMRAMTQDRADPGISLVANVPGVREDNELAIALLRTGVGLYGYEDELYEAAAIALAVSLLIGYTVRLPERDTALIRDAVRWFRIVLDRVPEGGELHSPDLEDLFIGALLNSVWTSEPFVRAQAASWRDGEGIPDVSRNQSVEDDLQSLRHLLETAARRRERPVPVYEMVLLLITFMRGKGELDDAAARHWRDRLRRASAYTDPAEESLKGFLLMAAGAFGYELARRGAAGPAELAEADGLLREGARHMPPGSDFAEWAGELRATGPATLIQQLLGVFTGGAGAPGAAAAGAPGAARRPADESVRAPGPARPPGSARPPGPVRPPTRSAPAEAEDIPLSAAAVLPGDGSPYPFTEPVGRVLEIVTGPAGPAGQRSAPVMAAHALALHRRWLHESEIADLADAVTLTRRAIAAADGTDGPLADRLSLLLAGMLRDRYLLIGDRMDLHAARTAYERLRDRSDPRAPHPELATLLARPGTAGQPDLAALLRPGRPAAPGGFSAELLAAAALTGLLAAREDGAADRAAAELAEAAAALPADHPLLPAVLSESGLFRATRAARADDLAALRAAVEDVVRAAALCPPGSAHRAPLLLRAAAVLCAHSDALDAADPAGPAAPGSRTSSLDRGIDLLSGAVDEAGPSFHGARARCRYGLGRLLLTRFRRTRDRADLDRAVGLLRDARTAVLSRPGDPFTVLLTRALAEALRAHGPEDPDHRAQSREVAKSVLAAHGRAVLLQTGTETALDSARAAGSDMMRLVEWCLRDGRTEEALEALELGRGLVLNAATVAASVPELLEREGRPELAEAWRRADPGRVPGTPADGPVVIPDGLRLLVLQALEGGPAERRILSAPTPAEIGRALRTVGHDALVHLIPGRDGAGDALIVTATGVVERLRLPGLCVTDDGPAAAYGEALQEFAAATREPVVLPGENDPAVMWELYRRGRKRLGRASDRWRGALDPLCSWAGEVAMAAVIEHVGAGRRHRPARLVLSPVGMLGMVPWHAARLPGAPGAPGASGAPGGGYACGRAVISYCSTSRQLVEVAARARLPWDGAQAVVADPGGTPAMHEEARLIAALYPGATVVGPVDDVPEPGGPGSRPPSRPATAAAVAPLLPGRGGSSAAVCHVNCHATARATPSASSLDLHPAAPVPQVLTLAEIQALAHGRDPSAPGGLLVLANCTSDLTLADYDEALTLSTAFLTSGAASVVGSLWAIADDIRTSMVMYVFHHYLTGRGLPGHPEAVGSPADALRAAQLWMLDPHRIVPPALSAVLEARPELDLDAPHIWAAFTHHGH
ncbi:CHAT domain protein [Streptomyces sp. ADI95-16]|uniref:CHAT domain-containing protein n=1 Tax=Streptomyces sp. ADI95-16 TaxID=1522758 RepID=UPI000F3A8836|nr:CHAT domain-containing protein [Streptomyces sp. ADI95-16]AYV31586.1 CHAT domain protein [Streptomyces sp. ADI95-16]